jgi:hypothetical protein
MKSIGNWQHNPNKLEANKIKRAGHCAAKLRKNSKPFYPPIEETH